jgi:hypothetical protein
MSAGNIVVRGIRRKRLLYVMPMVFETLWPRRLHSLRGFSFGGHCLIKTKIGRRSLKAKRPIIEYLE